MEKTLRKWKYGEAGLTGNYTKKESYKKSPADAGLYPEKIWVYLDS